MIKTSKYMMMAALLALAACGNNQETTTEEPEQSRENVQPTADGHLSIHAGDDMKFDQNYFEVKKGQQVTLTLHHTGKAPKATMGHNWVLLQTGSDLTDFGNKAAAAKDNDYIPASEQGIIIAHTKMIGGGETASVTFNAPTAPGEYPFLCSFPGHFAIMQGIFMVTE